MFHCDSSRCTLDTGGVKWPGRESDHSRHLAPKLRINSATLSLPNMYSWRGQGQIHFIYLLQTEVYEYYKRGGYEGTIIVSLSCDERRRRRRERKQRAVHAQKFLKFIKISFQPLLSGFGGLEVACWPLVPKYPLDFSGRKKKFLSAPSFGGEVKPSVPCRRFTACKRSLNVTWKSGIFRQNS